MVFYYEVHNSFFVRSLQAIHRSAKSYQGVDLNCHTCQQKTLCPQPEPVIARSKRAVKPTVPLFRSAPLLWGVIAVLVVIGVVRGAFMEQRCDQMLSRIDNAPIAKSMPSESEFPSQINVTVKSKGIEEVSNRLRGVESHLYSI